jgi:CheY-like chemotaxis protein
VSKEVLIVEDDRALCRSLARGIEKLGYSVREVHDGSAALEAVEQSLPDLVLLDLLLPKIDGLGVVRKLRESNRTKGLHFIAMSGVYRGASVVRDLEGAGVAAFLEKPFSARELAAHLERLLGPPEAEVAEEEDVERSDLSITPAPQLLWPPMRDGLSGVLHFQFGKRHKELLLDAGRPSAVRSNLAKETLGRRLFDAGHIEERAYQEAQRRGRATGQLQGGLLVKLGAISEAQLDRALLDQARDKLLDLLSWTEGDAWFVPNVRSVKRGTRIEGWTPRQVIVRGAGRIDASVLQRELEPHHACAATLDPSSIEGEEFGGAAEALIKELRRETHVGALVRGHGATLYAMWLVGCLRFGEPGKPGEAISPQADSGAGLAKELEQLARRQRSQNHLQVLGLQPDASEADARKAFFDLAKRYHPDKLGAESPEVAQLASEVFARISEAHEVLRDSEQRGKYLKQLKKGGSSGEDKAAVTRIVSAEQQFRKAEELIKRRQYPEAMEALQWALKLDPEEGEFHALLGWARFLTNPEDTSVRGQAIEHMEKATALAPKSPSGYYYLGKLHKACEELEAAEKMFRKVLELRPEHVEATQEVRLFEIRRTKGDRGTKGLFGRGKKK